MVEEIPSSMRAVAVERFGETPRVLRLPVPEPGPGEVLVRLCAAALNPFDWTIALGLVAGRAPHVFPLVLGVDGAGVVVRVGTGAARFQVGDAVYGAFLSPPYGRGTLADYAVVSEDAPIGLAPRAIPLVVAAGAPSAGMSALALLDLAALTGGESVLVVGATGGVGVFVTQLAHRRSARVIATARPDAVAGMCAFGAEAAVDHCAGPLAEQLAALAPGGVDVLLDLVSDPGAFVANLSLLRPGGRAVSTRYAATPATSIPPGVIVTNLDLTANHAGPLLLERLTAEIDAGCLTVPVTTVLVLEDAPAAVAAVQARGARGKTLIAIRDSLPKDRSGPVQSASAGAKRADVSENVRVVRAAQDAAARGDLERALQLCAPDCELWVPEGMFKGHDGVRRLLQIRREHGEGPGTRAVSQGARQTGEPEDAGNGLVLSRSLRASRWAVRRLMCAPPPCGPSGAARCCGLRASLAGGAACCGRCRLRVECLPDGLEWDHQRVGGEV